MLQESVSIESSLRSGLSDVIPFFPMNIYKQTTFESIYFLGLFFFFYEVFNFMSEVFIFYFFKARLIVEGKGVVWLCNSNSCCFFVPHLALE